MTRLIARTVVVAMAVVMGTGTIAFASGKAPTEERTLRIEFTTVGPAPGLGSPLCSPEGQCLVPVPPTSTTVTGDLEGTGYHAGTGSLLGEQVAGSATSLFVGTIEGCGTGAFVTAGPFTGTIDDIEYGTGKVLLGTGDFEGMTGTSTGGTSTSDGTTVTSQTRMRVKC